MNEFDLARDIADFLADELSKNQFEKMDRSISQVSVKKFIGIFPTKKNGQTDFPFVLIAPTNGQLTADGYEVTVNIYIGVKSEKDADGVAYLFNALGVVKRALAGLPYQTLGKFRFDLPLQWNYRIDQVFPFYEMEIITNWHLPSALQPLGGEL